MEKENIYLELLQIIFLVEHTYSWLSNFQKFGILSGNPHNQPVEPPQKCRR